MFAAKASGVLVPSPKRTPEKAKAAGDEAPQGRQVPLKALPMTQSPGVAKSPMKKTKVMVGPLAMPKLPGSSSASGGAGKGRGHASSSCLVEQLGPRKCACSANVHDGTEPLGFRAFRL